MELTYNDFLYAMEKEYIDSTGMACDDAGDLKIRFRILASQLFSMKMYGDFIIRQAFAQSASGEYLDMHCALRGIYRKNKSKAYGRLEFGMEEAVEEDIEIPKGTVCSVTGKSHLRFITIEKGIIEKGKLSVTVEAQAIGDGEEHNVQIGEVNVLVTPPKGVTYVINTERFRGGYDGENDEMLRKRFMESMEMFPNGINVQTMREAILRIDNVLDVRIVKDDLYKIVVRTVEDGVDEQVLKKIMEYLNYSILVPFKYYVVPSVRKSVDFKLKLVAKRGFDTQECAEKSKEKFIEYVRSLKLGESFFAENVGKLLYGVESVDSYTVEPPVVSATDMQYITENVVEVECYEK